MKKFKDYFIFGEVSVANVELGFNRAMADKIKILEVSKKEYICLLRFYGPKFPWNWQGKSLWGIKLVIREDALHQDNGSAEIAGPQKKN